MMKTTQVEPDVGVLVAGMLGRLSEAYQTGNDVRVKPTTIPVIRALLLMSGEERARGGLTMRELSEGVDCQQLNPALACLDEVVRIYSGGRLRLQRWRGPAGGRAVRYRLRWRDGKRGD